MSYEIELYFGGDDPHMTLTPVEAGCITELVNIAYRLQKHRRAEHVSFGPIIARDEDGQPDYDPRRSR